MRPIIICIRHLAKLDVICRSQMLSAEPAVQLSRTLNAMEASIAMPELISFKRYLQDLKPSLNISHDMPR